MKNGIAHDQAIGEVGPFAGLLGCVTHVAEKLADVVEADFIHLDHGLAGHFHAPCPVADRVLDMGEGGRTLATGKREQAFQPLARVNPGNGNGADDVQRHALAPMTEHRAEQVAAGLEVPVETALRDPKPGAECVDLDAPDVLVHENLQGRLNPVLFVQGTFLVPLGGAALGGFILHRGSGISISNDNTLGH